MARTSLSPGELVDSLRRLSLKNAEQSGTAARAHARQPVHTVYGGAHLFREDTTKKLGELALRSFEKHAAHFVALAEGIGLSGWEKLPEDYSEREALTRALHSDPTRLRRTNRIAWIADAIHTRVHEKLRTEAIEDYRIDFEDGYGTRSDEEEDGHAVSAGSEIARAMRSGSLPRGIGIRIKALDEVQCSRALRTLDLVLTELSSQGGGRLPSGFVVTLPKVSLTEQVSTLADALDALERVLHVDEGSIGIELMVEHPRAIFTEGGIVALPSLVSAGRGRVRAAHLGAFDFTASLDVTAGQQTMMHPYCDFARMIMATTLSRSEVALSDGATIDLPIEPHRSKSGALTPEQEDDNHRAIHRAWRVSYEHVKHSLRMGFYQGWDLHPAQIPVRYAATYAFFLDAMEAAGARLRRFLDQAARATEGGGTFDDAASGQGLLNFFLRGEGSGALTAAEVTAETGLGPGELASRSFVEIVAARQRRK